MRRIDMHSRREYLSDAQRIELFRKVREPGDRRLLCGGFASTDRRMIRRQEYWGQRVIATKAKNWQPPSYILVEINSRYELNSAYGIGQRPHQSTEGMTEKAIYYGLPEARRNSHIGQEDQFTVLGRHLLSRSAIAKPSVQNRGLESFILSFPNCKLRSNLHGCSL